MIQILFSRKGSYQSSNEKYGGEGGQGRGKEEEGREDGLQMAMNTIITLFSYF